MSVHSNCRHGMDKEMNSDRNQSAATTAQPKLSPDMERLSFLLGTWHAADKYEKTAFNPNGGKGKGVYRTVIGPGGFSLLTDYEYEAPHGRSNGHYILAWDSRQRCYMGSMVSSSFPGCLSVTANWEDTTLVLTGEFEARGKKVAFRQTFTDITPARMVLRQYNSIDGAPSQLFGTTVFTKEENR